MDKVSEPKVIVQLLAWSQVDEVATCLESFSCIMYSNYEIVLIDNGSEDDTVKLVREKFPFVTIIDNGENVGFCKGNNIGIQHCLKKDFDYLLLLNVDTKVQPNLIHELVRVMKTDPKIGIAGAKNLMLENPDYMWGQYGKVTWGPMLSKIVGRFEPDLNINAPPEDVDWVICNGCMISRIALETVGGFDENFWTVHEDVDLSYRARLAGFRVVYVDTTSILHKGGSSINPRRNQIFSYGYFLARNSFMFAKKHATPFQMVKLFFMVWLGVIVRLTLTIVMSIIYSLKTLLMNIKGIVGGQYYFIRGILDGLRGRLSPDYIYIYKARSTPTPSPPKPERDIIKQGKLVRVKRWIGF